MKKIEKKTNENRHFREESIEDEQNKISKAMQNIYTRNV